GIQAGWLRDYLRAHGVVAFLVHGTVDDLRASLAAGRPVLVGLAHPDHQHPHYEVVAAINLARGVVVTIDPAHGWRERGTDEFAAAWDASQRLTIIVHDASAP